MRNVILVSSGRKGTFLILTALERHPQIFCHEQLFGQDHDKRHPFVRGLNGYEAAFRLFSRDWLGIQPQQRIVFPVAPTEQDKYDQSIWRYVDEHPDISLIHLRRRNLLKGYISMLVARETGRWANRYPALTPEPAIHVDPAAAERYLRWDLKESVECQARYSARSSLVICYEDLVADLQYHYGLIQAFLDVEPRPLWPRTCKQASRSLETAISNYSELTERWKGTEFEQYLK